MCIMPSWCVQSVQSSQPDMISTCQWDKMQGCQVTQVSLYSSEPHCPCTVVLGNLTVNDQISLYSYPRCIQRVETLVSLLMISCLFNVLNNYICCEFYSSSQPEKAEKENKGYMRAGKGQFECTMMGVRMLKKRLSVITGLDCCTWHCTWSSEGLESSLVQI